MRSRSGRIGVEAPSFFYATVSISSTDLADVLRGQTNACHRVSSRCSSTRANPGPLPGLIWPKGGCASIALGRNGGGGTFFP